MLGFCCIIAVKTQCLSSWLIIAAGLAPSHLTTAAALLAACVTSESFSLINNKYILLHS